MASTMEERLRATEARIAELEARLAPGREAAPEPERKPYVRATRPPDPPPPPLWRFTIAPIPTPGGIPQRTGVTVSPTNGRGEQVPTVYGTPRSAEPGRTGEQAIVVQDTDIVVEPLATFLRAKGYGGNLAPCPPPTDGRSPVSAPRFVREWVRAEVAAGRLVLTAATVATLPPVEARRRLREAAGLSRPQVAEQLGVSREALRKWETGELEPAGENRRRYAELLASWGTGAQQSAVPERGEDPPLVQEMLREAEETAAELGRPLGAADIQRAREAAYRQHRQRMASPVRPRWTPGDLVPRRRFDGTTRT